MVYYPLNLDITGKCCLVVGGGKVAWRKVRSLLGCDARVRVVSPEVVPEIELMAGRNQLIWERREYRKGDVEGAVLVFAATDSPEVQQEVAGEAGEIGVLLNSADDPERSDFHVPAKVRRGELLLTISTGGGSPSISRMVRKELEEQFGREYGALIYLFSIIRGELLAVSGDSEANRKMFRELLDSNILDYVREGRSGEIETLLRRVLPAELDTAGLVTRLLDFVQDDGTGS